MRVIVLPPIWKRWWFVTMAMVFAAIFAYAIHRYRLMRVVELEHVRTRIATDLHDDIGSGLSQVAMLSEIARRRVVSVPTATEPLSRIGELSRDLVDSMNDIVWAINPRRDHASDLTHRMRRFASEILAGHDIALEFRAEGGHEDRGLGADIRREVWLIFKESVNNIARHAGCTRADISVRLTQSHLELRLADNGKGLTPEPPGTATVYRACDSGRRDWAASSRSRRHQTAAPSSPSSRQSADASWAGRDRADFAAVRFSLQISVGGAPAELSYADSNRPCQESMFDENSAQHAAPVITVAIIEDQQTLRDGFALLIDGVDGFRCAGAFRSMEEALPAIDSRVPDVVLVDIGLPGMNGIDGVRLLKERHPALTMLMLTVYDDDDRVFEALCAGASGYLLKKTPPARVLDSIKEAAAGGSPMSPEIARKVVQLFRIVRPPKPAEHDLTLHELRLLDLLVDGHSYKTAAAALGVSYNTVSFHVRNIYSKLQVHSKSEAVAKALRDKLTG